MIDQRISDHQLDECDLTLRDVRVIAERFRFTLDDDAAQPHRLSQAGNEIAHAARRFRPARCNGDNPQAGDGAAGLRRVSAAQVDRALRRAMR